jgi:dienelactone hydrolase
MPKFRWISVLVLSAFLPACSAIKAINPSPSPEVSLQTHEVLYSDGSQVLQGYLAYDKAFPGKRPGVLIVHEWWGHNDYVRKRAEMLADLGYVAFALDMYGDGRQASHPKEAAEFSGEIQRNHTLGMKRFLAAYQFLRKQGKVDPERIAAIGYCFGGAVVLHMARAGVDLDGVVSFHGSLATDAPAKAGLTPAKVLVLHGGSDKFVLAEEVANFVKEMEAAGVDYQMVTYPEAMHGFTNPNATLYGEKFNIPLQYNGEADRESWEEMKTFLKEIFKE